MRLIDADKMALDELKAYQNTFGEVDDLTDKVNYVVHTKIQMLIRDTPTVEAEPVRHGRWIRDENGDIICSECGKLTMDMQDEAILGADGGWAGFALKTPNYCSRCGAKMDGKENG